MDPDPESRAGPPAYFIVEIEVHDAVTFASYFRQVEATFQPFGGRIVRFGATLVPAEGIESVGARIGIVAFPTLKAGEDWFASPAYRKIVPLRHQSAKARAFFVEGPFQAPLD
jgi:uncharacterized protein (DUF1330 family)